MLAALQRLALGALLALCAFGLAACAILLAGATVPDWLLPLAALLGLGAGCLRPSAAPPREPIAWPWLLGSLLLLGTATAGVAWGSLATPSRHWDGAVAWELHARALAAAPTLAQPFFDAPEVFCHSRDYPLLQPLLVAFGDRWFDAGRGLFPLLYVLMLVVGGTALRQHCSQRLAWAGTVALGLTPLLISPNAGSVDSGYAELLLLLATTAMAAGLLRRDSWLLALGACLAVLSKPEGLAYGVLPALVGAICSDRGTFRAGCTGWLLGAVAWVPVHLQLARFAVPTGILVTALAGVLVAALAVDRLLARPRRPRTRWLLLLLLLALGAAMATALPYAAGSRGTLGSYLSEPGRALQRLPQLPAMLLGLLEFALLKKFGLTFALPLALAAARLRRRIDRPPAAAAWLLGLGLCTVMLPFLLSPEPDLVHHLKSSMERLLLHWIGPAWLLTMAWLGAAAEDRRPESDGLS